MRLFAALSIVAFSVSVAGLHLSDGYQWTELSVTDQEVVKQAELAVKELRKLSESGIYETIQLKEIKSAAAADGIFHKNMKLVVDLYSPHLRSKLPAEEYEMLVMQRHDDGSWTFTINEFPLMDELAIENFYIRMVERRRREREEATNRLEAEHLATLEREKRTGIYSKSRLSDMDIDQLWNVFETTTDAETKENAVHYMKARGVGTPLSPTRTASDTVADTASALQRNPFKVIDNKLEKLTARQLHQVVVADHTDQHDNELHLYERFRAQELLSTMLEQTRSSAS